MPNKLARKDVRPQLRRIDRAKQRSKDILAELIRQEMDVMNQCPHPDEETVEGSYADHGWLGCDPPFLVCRLCGYAEDTWGCGPWRLKYTNLRLPRAEALELVRQRWSQDDLNKIRFPERKPA